MTKQFRTLFLSDIHLGSRHCNAELLLQTLNKIKADTIYLLGDIVDLWELKKNHHWQSTHTAVLNHFKTLAQQGVRIVYVPGNHDAPLRQHCGVFPPGIEICRETEHRTKRNKRLLLIHGDCFDNALYCAPWLYWLGDRAYDLLLYINRHYARLSFWRGKPYRSLAGFVKQRFHRSQQLLHTYRQLALQHAKDRGFDGIVCGHIHHPELFNEASHSYGNCGDWIESYTLLAEDNTGNLHLLDASQLDQTSASTKEALPQAA
ncbi:UDP-2,3-diacylglucosamine diphosphatase [Simiduia litorea]|uniref:UDP-2,3-diacylglucosamine diphosphatase n=1 Tax=Simiduia litorea TaxID=1435348 RepID=UPI0036F3CCE0